MRIITLLVLAILLPMSAWSSGTHPVTGCYREWMDGRRVDNTTMEVMSPAYLREALTFPGDFLSDGA